MKIFLKKIYFLLKISLGLTLIIFVLTFPPTFKQIKYLSDLCYQILYNTHSTENLLMQIGIYSLIFLLIYLAICLFELILIKIDKEKESILIQEEHESVLNN